MFVLFCRGNRLITRVFQKRQTWDDEAVEGAAGQLVSQQSYYIEISTLDLLTCNKNNEKCEDLLVIPTKAHLLSLSQTLFSVLLSVSYFTEVNHSSLFSYTEVRTLLVFTTQVSEWLASKSFCPLISGQNIAWSDCCFARW